MDFEQQLTTFQPTDATERTAKKQILTDWKKHGTALFLRDFPVHFTVSAIIMNPSLDKVLMVHHNLFKTWCWAGGHIEQREDFLQAALREAHEETGARYLAPLTGQILSLDVLFVDAHTRQGEAVPAHTHYSVAFGLIAPEKHPLQSRPDENSGVRWIPVEEFRKYCAEAHMIPIYEKICRRMQRIARQKKTALSKLPAALLSWYHENARDLPWRKDREPYHVWLSEIMLQQTRVEAVRGYYTRFLSALPNIETLANAEEAQVLKLWEGLGYYSRARNLHKAAKQIMTDFGGEFPTEYSAIRALAGIGDYTAGAISSICFDAPQPAVDGNVIRVISRLCEFFSPAEQLKKDLIPILKEIYPIGQCGDFTQSLMELGATVCVPNGVPECQRCPLMKMCLAYRNHTTALLPHKAEKKSRKIVQKTVFYLTCDDNLAIRQRPPKGLLAGLWELPNMDGDFSPQEALEKADAFGVHPTELEKTIQRVHIFTHVEWHMTCYYLKCKIMCDEFVWVTEDQRTADFALPTAFRIFLE